MYGKVKNYKFSINNFIYFFSIDTAKIFIASLKLLIASARFSDDEICFSIIFSKFDLRFGLARRGLRTRCGVAASFYK